jgi:hypothetical protein
MYGVGVRKAFGPAHRSSHKKTPFFIERSHHREDFRMATDFVVSSRIVSFRIFFALLTFV